MQAPRQVDGGPPGAPGGIRTRVSTSGERRPCRRGAATVQAEKVCTVFKASLPLATATPTGAPLSLCVEQGEHGCCVLGPRARLAFWRRPSRAPGDAPRHLALSAEGTVFEGKRQDHGAPAALRQPRRVCSVAHTGEEAGACARRLAARGRSALPGSPMHGAEPRTGGPRAMPPRRPGRAEGQTDGSAIAGGGGVGGRRKPPEGGKLQLDG